jgi:D-alanyl-D-alanine endopeptidase (penicillin-binding protein 7)
MNAERVNGRFNGAKVFGNIFPSVYTMNRIERIGFNMASRFVMAVLGLFLLPCAVDLHASSIPSARAPKLRSAAFVVQDQRTGEFLLSKQAETAMPIASITKLMTAMVLLDAHLDMEEILTIQEGDKDTLRNSHSHLLVGTRLTRRDALRVALMASENRAAHALGRTYPGGVRALVSAMNEKARTLGLAETKFEDPTGLSDGNISTAHDLSRLVAAACHYPVICAFTTQREATLRLGRRQLKFINTNALVRNSRWQIGLSKTGYIEEGGRCLVMQTLLAKRPVLIVLLNSTGKNTRIGDANRIRQWMEASESPKKPPKHKSRRA